MNRIECEDTHMITQSLEVHSIMIIPGDPPKEIFMALSFSLLPVTFFSPSLNGTLSVNPGRIWALVSPKTPPPSASSQARPVECVVQFKCAANFWAFSSSPHPQNTYTQPQNDFSSGTFPRYQRKQSMNSCWKLVDAFLKLLTHSFHALTAQTALHTPYTCRSHCRVTEQGIPRHRRAIPTNHYYQTNTSIYTDIQMAMRDTHPR